MIMYKKIDANQKAIVAALRDAGASVVSLAGIGRGCPDLLVGFRGQNYLLEVKNLDGKGDWLTDAEQEFFDGWRGQAIVARSIDDALALLGVE